MDYQTATTTGRAVHFVRSYVGFLDENNKSLEMDVQPYSFPVFDQIGNHYQLFSILNMDLYANPVGNPIDRTSNLALGVNADSSNTLFDPDNLKFSSNILRLRSSKLLQKDTVGEVISCKSFRKNYYVKQIGIRRLEIPLVIVAALVNSTPVSQRLSPWRIYADIHFEFYNPTFNFISAAPSIEVDFSLATVVVSNETNVQVSLPLIDGPLSESKLIVFEQNVNFAVTYSDGSVIQVNSNQANVAAHSSSITTLSFSGTFKVLAVNESATLSSVHSVGVVSGNIN